MATYGQSSRTPVYQYDDDTAVASTTETTILSYTVPVSTTFYIQGLVATGSAAFRFRIKVDGVTKLTDRTSAADRTSRTTLGDGGFSATAGQVVIITAYHEEVANQTAEVALVGYTE